MAGDRRRPGHLAARSSRPRIHAPIFGAYDGRLLGALRVLPAGQFLARPTRRHGRRGRRRRPARGARPRASPGPCSTESLAWMRAEGIAVSSLHPASTRVVPLGRVGDRRGRGPRRDPDPQPRRDPHGGRRGRRPARARATDAELESLYARWAPSVHGTLDRVGAVLGDARRVGRHGRYVHLRRALTTASSPGYVRYEQLPRVEWGYASGSRTSSRPTPRRPPSSGASSAATRCRSSGSRCRSWRCPSCCSCSTSRTTFRCARTAGCTASSTSRGSWPSAASGRGSITATVRLTDPWARRPGRYVDALAVRDGVGSATAAAADAPDAVVRRRRRRSAR